MPAGDNERVFKELIRQSLGNVLLGKRSWRMPVDTSTVSISVDETIETQDYRLLIEVDSNNYAKLIVGQYMLLNALNQDQLDSRRDVFVIIHYNGRNNNNPYNPNRTIRNLNFCNQRFLGGNGVPFLVFNINDFRDFISSVNSLESLNTQISQLLEI